MCAMPALAITASRPPGLADEALDGRVQRSGVADVGGHHDRSRELGRRAPRSSLLVARDEADRRAAARQRPRGRAPDAAGGAGQDHPGIGADLHRGGAYGDWRQPVAGSIPMAADQATVAEEEYLQIIFWLEEAKLPITGANIARAMQLSPPTVHEMVGRLEGDGYVEPRRGQGDRVHRQGPRGGRGDRPPPPADRALPHRRPRASPGTRSTRRPSASSTRCRRCSRSACSPRSATPRPAPTAIRSSRAPARRALCSPTSSRARRSASCASRTRPRSSSTTSRTSGLNPGLEGELKSSDDAEVVVSSADGEHSVSRSVAETVSVTRRPGAAAPRAPLPEQLVLSTRQVRALGRGAGPRVRSSAPGEPVDPLGRSDRRAPGRRRGAGSFAPPSIMKSGPATKVTPSSLASVSSSAVSTSSSRSSHRK